MKRVTTLTVLMIMLAFGVLFATPAKAQIISEQQVAAQHEVVKTRLLATMHEQVKLLQMILIRHLEARFQYLEARQ